jgi:hypothetical protein
VTWDKPVAIAGVRLRQTGAVADGFTLKLEAVAPDGKVESIVPKIKAN